MDYIIATVAFLMATSILIKYLGVHCLWGAAALFGWTLFAYFLNVRLIVFYISKIDPEMMRDGSWELTAGTGVVPKWVSWLGLSTVPAAIAGVLWILAYYDIF